jgi:hypothetical protein
MLLLAFGLPFFHVISLGSEGAHGFRVGFSLQFPFVHFFINLSQILLE